MKRLNANVRALDGSLQEAYRSSPDRSCEHSRQRNALSMVNDLVSVFRIQTLKSHNHPGNIYSRKSAENTTLPARSPNASDHARYSHRIILQS